MDSFSGVRAVVTGGASGIGLGLATGLLEDGASRVVLADIEPEALSAAVANLAARGFDDVEGVVCDVSDPASVETLAVDTWSRLGGVEVVCLNAGVFAGGYSWETTLDDWDWVLGVNLRGMVNGIRSFLPRIIEAGVPSHVIGTASIAGVVAAPVSAVYCTSKFAAVGLMESLQHDLVLAGASHVATSVICPGMVKTNIDHGDRNRPADLTDATKTDASNLAQQGIEDALGSSALDPFVGARHALEQAKSGRFYVTTHAGDMWDRLVGNENDDRLAGRPPRFQMYE
jgi:NAD(P)-dependent dehydrogenase (short-subunit alcohol dehydrogenase family)